MCYKKVSFLLICFVLIIYFDTSNITQRSTEEPGTFNPYESKIHRLKQIIAFG